MPKKLDLTSRRRIQNLGSMSKRILIQKRKDVYTSSGNSLTYETVWTRWAELEAVSGLKQFNGINIDDTPTHICKIRSISTLTSEYWINYSSTLYRIVRVETYKEFQVLYLKLTGSSSLNGAKQ